MSNKIPVYELIIEHYKKDQFEDFVRIANGLPSGSVRCTQINYILTRCIHYESVDSMKREMNVFLLYIVSVRKNYI